MNPCPVCPHNNYCWIITLVKIGLGILMFSGFKASPGADKQKDAPVSRFSSGYVSYTIWNRTLKSFSRFRINKLRSSHLIPGIHPRCRQWWSKAVMCQISLRRSCAVMDCQAAKQFKQLCCCSEQPFTDSLNSCWWFRSVSQTNWGPRC